MADRVQYLPMDLVSTLPFRFKHLESEDIEKVIGLLTEAHGRGYHDGFVRGGVEEHGRQYLLEQKQKAAASRMPSSTEGVHPGEILRDELRDRGITQVAFAEMLDRPAQVVSEVINGKKNITADTALDLERALGIEAEFWVRAQADYDLSVARQRRGVPSGDDQAAPTLPDSSQEVSRG